MGAFSLIVVINLLNRRVLYQLQMNSDLRAQNQSLLGKLKANQLALKQSSNFTDNSKDAVQNAKRQMLNIKTKQSNSISSSQTSIRSSTPKIAQYTKILPKTAVHQSNENGDNESFLNKLESSGNARAITSGPIVSNTNISTPVVIGKTSLNKPKDLKSNLLGYDWISEMLEMDLSYENKTDDYFQNLRTFREQHASDCYAEEKSSNNNQFLINSNAFPLPSYVSKSELASVENANTHQCVHLYRMNSRGFAIPVNVNENGESICPVCKTIRVKDGKTMVRVTVPKSLLPDFDRVDLDASANTVNTVSSSGLSYAKRDNLYNTEYCPGDSVGLSQHVITGWRSARPTCATPATFVDIKSASN